MANMIDYLAWRGEFGFDITPWNEIDALLFSTLSYLSFRNTDDVAGVTLGEARKRELLEEEDKGLFPARKEMFLAMADSRRFENCRMHHFISLTDGEQSMQFSAICYDLPDNTLCIAFRGTDSTVVGWREDMNMSLLETVPAQTAALQYLTKAAELDNRGIRLVGHSKGGNLAAYAGALAPEEIQNRILGIYSFDGPGMAPDVFNSEGYQRIAPKINSFVPQTSVVGMLMEYHRKYTVVHSTASGMQQHNQMTWEVYGPRFVTLEKLDEASENIRAGFRTILEKSEPEERAAVLDAIFDMIESTGAVNIGDVMTDKMKSIRSMIAGGKEMTPDKVKDLGRMMGQFFAAGVSNMLDRYRQRKPEEEQEESPQELPSP